jgi:hypothetical protein
LPPPESSQPTLRLPAKSLLAAIPGARRSQTSESRAHVPAPRQCRAADSASRQEHASTHRTARRPWFPPHHRLPIRILSIRRRGIRPARDTQLDRYSHNLGAENFTHKKPPGNNRAVYRGGTPGRIRTCGLWVRNPTLYPLSYRRVCGNSTPNGRWPAEASRLRREGRDSNPRNALTTLNRLAGGPIRPLWHLPKGSLPRCPGARREQNPIVKFTTPAAQDRWRAP